MRTKHLLIAGLFAFGLTAQAQTVTYTIGGKTETKSIEELPNYSLNRATDITVHGQWTGDQFRRLPWLYKEASAIGGNKYMQTMDISEITFYDNNIPNYSLPFSDLPELTSIKMATKEVTYAFSFQLGFTEAAKLNTGIDLSMFTNITNMKSCFNGCTALPSVTLCNNLRSITNWENAFKGVKDGFIIWIKGSEADADLGMLPMEYRPFVKYTIFSEKKRGMTLDLSKSTSNNTSAMETEGWAWYYTATDKYPAKTLLMDGCNITIPNGTNDNYGIMLPDGATIQLAPGSKNVISLGTSTKNNIGVYALGALTIGQNDGTGKLTIKSDKAETVNHGILVTKDLTMNGDTLAVIGGQSKMVYGIYIIGEKATFNSGVLDIEISSTSGQVNAERYGIFGTKLNINGGSATINCAANNAAKKIPITGTITSATGMELTGETNAPIRGWQNTTNITNSTTDAGFTLAGGKGYITVTAQEAQTVQLVTIDGRTVRTIQLNADEAQAVSGLTAGIYIVKGQKAVVY